MAPVAASYDKDNIFAKILRGEIPCKKIFENRHVIAILDAFPVTKGHVLVIPKAMGYCDLMDMPPRVVCDVTSSLPTVARAVKAACNCEGVNIVTNCGASAGQTVFHPHFHIIPREEGDDVLRTRTAAGQLDEAEGEEMEKAMKEMLEASKPAHLKKSNALALRKPRFKDVSKISPGQSGLNIKAKCIKEPTPISPTDHLYECTFADHSAAITFSLRKEQINALHLDETYEIRNFQIVMVKGHIRGIVDKWGKIKNADQALDQVKCDNNVSTIEYELVK